MGNEGDELTPMMRQYQEIKGQYKDEVLFFRLGDFYEMFEDDAIEVSRLLNLTLTHRGASPMCGIPYHSAAIYLKRLLDVGKKVAICEQLELADKPKELAKREVVQIFSPGTVIEDEYLDSFSASYILSVNYLKGEFVVAYADITTGDFYIQHLKRDERLESLASVISSLQLKEILVPEDLYFTDKVLRKLIDSSRALITKLPSSLFALKKAANEVRTQFQLQSLKGFGLDEGDTALSAAGALLYYYRQMCKSALPQIRNLVPVSSNTYMFLDEATEKNLELVKNLNDGKNNHTLYSAMNRTCTSAGARILAQVITHPLTDSDKINERQNWCQFFIDNGKERNRVRTLLASSADLSRLSSKFEMQRSTPRDLVAVRETLKSFFALVLEHEDYLSLLSESLVVPEKLVSLAQELDSAVSSDCVNLYKEGEVILNGYDEKLDELRRIASDSSGVLNEFLERLKAELDIPNLRIGENKIIGYYIEVSNSHIAKVPPTFIRRQTLVGKERYTSEELSNIEEEIKSAEADSAEREKLIYNSLVERVFSLSSELRKIADLLASLDLFQSFATLSLERGYSRPTLAPPLSDLIIKDGRHPVVEQYLDQNEFVSNSLDTTSSRFALITGPNMAGKSTFLRQTALIVLMAHTGCFVPATSAQIPLIDKIFCRVGASDNLTRGESTFLIEMQESAYILRNATASSLVIMDEIGRGTSTQDGMSLAYAIMHYLFDLNSITLFATHYHELTQMDTSGMQLLTLEVSQNKKEITFVRKVVKGVAESSYGLHVARLAGIPQSVIKKASIFQRKHFEDYSVNNTDQLDLFVDTTKIEEDYKSEIIDALADFDTLTSTPIEAIVLINKLQEKLKNHE